MDFDVGELLVREPMMALISAGNTTYAVFTYQNLNAVVHYLEARGRAWEIQWLDNYEGWNKPQPLYGV